MGKRVIKKGKAARPSANTNCGCGCLPVSKK
jgi:hypothetical protein